MMVMLAGGCTLMQLLLFDVLIKTHNVIVMVDVICILIFFLFIFRSGIVVRVTVIGLTSVETFLCENNYSIIIANVFKVGKKKKEIKVIEL